jgi:hypothetical protein
MSYVYMRHIRGVNRIGTDFSTSPHETVVWRSGVSVGPFPGGERIFGFGIENPFAPGLRFAVTSCHKLAIPVRLEEGLRG